MLTFEALNIVRDRHRNLRQQHGRAALSLAVNAPGLSDLGAANQHITVKQQALTFNSILFPCVPVNELRPASRGGAKCKAANGIKADEVAEWLESQGYFVERN